uniref:Uncharacterized protein LOC104234072 n=1 Tax=Nicotiana sylvestris TaxID=4096 RepID=A0A1U7X892_NICSY|nr:PREDICTED: uncharacterized protein LOC104234072 [Nicotiana sylvestris]
MRLRRCGPLIASVIPSASMTPLPHMQRRTCGAQSAVSNNTTTHIKIKVNEVNNLPIGEHIIVDFDNYDAAYGEAQGLLTGYCGLLAIDGNFFPINFDRTTNAIAYRYCNASLNKKWATHRHRLWDEFYDPAKSRTELLSNVSSGMNRDQWAGFVAYRLKSSTIESCRKNKEIRRKQTMPHTGGSKANSRRRHELEGPMYVYGSSSFKYIQEYQATT